MKDYERIIMFLFGLVAVFIIVAFVAMLKQAPCINEKNWAPVGSNIDGTTLEYNKATEEFRSK